MVLKDAIGAVGEGLKGSPVIFGLVVINVIFVALMLFLLWSVSQSIERRDNMISDVIRHCYQKDDSK